MAVKESGQVKCQTVAINTIFYDGQNSAEVLSSFERDCSFIGPHIRLTGRRVDSLSNIIVKY